MTARVVLRDDPDWRPPTPWPQSPGGPGVSLPEDGEGPTPVSVNPVLTVRRRVRTGYDADGVAQFDWTTLVEGPSIMWTEREEFDARSGMSETRAKATLLYGGNAEVTETAGVWVDGSTQWRVTAVRQVPGRLEFDLSRLSGEKVAEDAP